MSSSPFKEPKEKAQEKQSSKKIEEIRDKEEN